MCEAEGVGVRVLLRCDEESCDDCVAGTTRSGGGMSSPTKLSCDMAGEREVDVEMRWTMEAAGDFATTVSVWLHSCLLYTSDAADE